MIVYKFVVLLVTISSYCVTEMLPFPQSNLRTLWFWFQLFLWAFPVSIRCYVASGHFIQIPYNPNICRKTSLPV